MDRSKSRTDLLAAGRKKLQQFRQKKDSKGGSNRGKSSKNSGKPQLPESDAASSASISMESSQINDGHDSDSNRVVTESSESHSVENSLSFDNIDPSVDSSSLVTTNDASDETELDSNTNLALQVHGVRENDSELSALDQGVIAQDIGADVPEDESLRTSDIPVPEGEATYDHVHVSAPAAILSPHASLTTAVGESVTHEREGEKREELLLLSEDIPNTSVMQAREDQVTDLGAMQEADGLDMKKSCQSIDAVIDGQKELPLSDVGKSDQSPLGIALEKTKIEEEYLEAEQLDKSVELLSSLEDIVSDKLPGFDKGQGDHIATAEPSMRNLERETLPGSSDDKMLLQSNQDQISKGVLIGQDGGLQEEGISQKFTSVGFAVEDPTHEVDSARPWDASSVFDENSVNLLQLAEIMRGLKEEEYQFLLKARGAGPDLNPLARSSDLSDHDISEAFQSLKEEFFITNLMKNIFNMQLDEQLELLLESDNKHHQLIDEMSQLHASHNKVNEENRHLAEELANCHVELRDISSKNVELQNQFNAARAEVEALSTRVVELQSSFNVSQKDSLELSSELADCRGLISSLQVEKKGMIETIDLVIVEKNKLVEEREFHLCQITNLATELSDFKSSMEGVKVDNSNLIDRISKVTEERNIIKAEIEHLSHEIDRLSSELVDSKDLVARLRAENSNINGTLALSTDKIKNLEYENQHLVLENQMLSSQTIALQEQLSSEKGERMMFEGELKEATVRLEQISNENVYLNSTLDEHKAKIEEIGKEQGQPLSQPRDLGNQTHVACEQNKGLEIASTEDSLHMDQEPHEAAPGEPQVNILEHEVFDDSLGFVSWKACLDEVEDMLVKLEKAINLLHFHSVSSGRSGENVSSPRVSKLIQAFESKVHEDENEAETRDSSEVQSSSISFIMLTKEQIETLKKLLSKWRVDIQIAGVLFKGERDGRKTGDAKYSDLKDQFDELKQHCSDLEASNIELQVQCETAKQILGNIQEKKCLLEEICDALKQEDIHLKAKNNELYERLGYCQSKINDLHTEMCGLKQSSNDMASIIGGQLKDLHKVVTERAMLLEQGWNTTTAEIVELIGKLNESIGVTLCTTVSSNSHGNFDISNQLEVSVNAAAETIFDLRKKLEATYSEHEIMCMSYKEMNSKCDDLLRRNDLAVGLLHTMYGDLRKLVLSNGGSMDDDNVDVQIEALPDLLNYDSYQPILKHLVNILNEKLELESVTKETKSELMHRETELEELKMKCNGLDSVSKLIEDVASLLNVEISEMDINKSPLSCLDSLVSSLVQKTREAEIQCHMTKEGYESKGTELAELKGKTHYLDTLRLENENEILVLKESLHQTEEALTAARSELQKKADELEHSEQRVSSIREKLSIAVAKGKGLVVQRDGLKQSLAETSSELERCLQELQLKDTRLNEVETKLKTYAEAGERVEALESELSYIRNSANALRESFLLKDSMLQRIEEILEDLDLPEQFHSGDIIEKIDWLASSASGNSLPMNDWEQRDSVGGGSYSDAGYVVTESWKDESQLQPDSGDDFRKKTEELQSKYYELAEQNEMLEQSLMERNSLVQRWEELVNRIDMPSHLQSTEMEDRIEWIGRALAEANHHVDSLHMKIEKYNSYCGLLNADLEESQRTVSSLQGDLGALTSERDHLSEKMKALMHECEKLSLQTSEAELENEKLHNEITSLKHKLEEKVAIEEQIFTIDGKIKKLQDLVVNALSESESENLVSGSTNIDSLEELLRKVVEKLNLEEKLSVQTREAELLNEKLHNEITSLKDKLEQKAAMEEQFFTIDGKIRKLLDLVSDALSESETENLVSDSENIDSLEELLRKLIQNHANVSQESDATLHEERSKDVQDMEEVDIDRYRRDLEESLNELVHVKEDRDRTLEKQISLSGEVEALTKRTEELQVLLNQEEQKSASVREKLNVAVRKGKTLVQQRDSLKQTIEEMSGQMEHLKSEINNREQTLAEHEQKLRHLSTYPDRLEALESENLLLKQHLEETDRHSLEQEYSLKLILNKLGEIEVGGEGHTSDPVKKLEWIGKFCCDLNSAVTSLEQESRKSKRASELLLAELNEVQERNDSFQEELGNVAAELVDLRRERDSAEAAKLEALAHLEKLSALHEEGKKSHFSDIMELKSSVNQVCKSFGEVQNLLANVFLMDLESYRKLEAGLELCMKGNNATNMVDSSVTKEHDGILPCSSAIKSSTSADPWSDFDTMDHHEDNTIVEIFHVFGHQLQELLVEVGSLKERIDMHTSLAHEQDKTLSKLMASVQMEMTSQRESCEAMKKEVSERDGELVALRGNIAYLYEACVNSVIVLENGKNELVGKNVESSDLGINLETPSFDDGISEERIKIVTDRLLLAAKGFASIKTEFLDANQKEMKTTIANLQRELQEKDVQRDRICSELVKQIKDAEAAANSYSQDLQAFRVEENNLKKQVEAIEAERKILEQRVNELQDRQETAAELEEKMRSQTDLLGAKDQEIEALMHALDEEEMQMEELTKKIVDLEKVVQQKNQEIENIESSRGKVMKKLSITVSKFDELHHLSASLLSEVEKLQSQLQERDTEISFLRQEVTRCTNDVLVASQMNNQRSSGDIFEFLMWVDTIVSRDGIHDIHPDMKSNNQVHECKEILQKKLTSLLSELANLMEVVESKDAMLQVERSKVEELNRKTETLEMSLHKKELQLNLLEGVEETGKGAGTSSEIVEVEPVMNEWSSSGAFVTPQVRSLRKGNNDHVAIAVDVDPGSTSRIEDEEDDKVHGFKSLTTSKIVPRFTRPLTDLIDGLWVSCDRTLMRQPVLRLGIIIYWVIMHALLAFFVV
ncbi:centromere-associated protein E isoform X2 [Abrus precatorius]|uniref:Centromere-associated protein E isoform X2 n=1 Tax=Abrus precatorius TaxID=3816 RepID=A0A8B8JPV1_ABRPR|nr:centromere-associated protein E isoform X2 [Abrus precatorius]